MSVIDRIADSQFALLAKTRWRGAEGAVAQSGSSGAFDELGDSGYLLLATFRRDGGAVPAIVMFSRRDGNVYIRSESRAWKIRRARRDPHVRLARCNMRGKPLSPLYEGRARELPAGEQARAHDALFDGYSAPIGLLERGLDRAPIEIAYLEISPVEGAREDEPDRGQGARDQVVEEG